jgi:hypothetical protein
MASYTPLPPAPVPGSVDFEQRAGRFLDAMPVFGAEMKALADEVAAGVTIVDVDGNATIAATAASQAALSATKAHGNATDAAKSAASALESSTIAKKKANEASINASQSGINALAAAGSAASAAASAALADSEGNATAAQNSAVASAGSAAEAARQADLATENGAAQVHLAAEQAGISTTKANESADSAVASQASANNAANAVYSQLLAVKTQTEAARDAAIAGLGAADNSQALAELQAAREIMRAEPFLQSQVTGLQSNLSNYDLLIERLTYQATHLADLAGVIGRAISGGRISLQGGTAAIPSLTSVTDVTAGVFFPAAGVVALATAALERLRVTADGRLGLGTTAPSGLLDVADNKIRVRTAQTPASATAAGNQGEIAWDANFLYVCTATNTWRRAALASW